MEKTRLSCLVLSTVHSEMWTEFTTVADSFQYIGDRTVWSCLRCERIWEQDKTQFTLHFETVAKFSVADNLDLSPVQFTPRTRTRQDKIVRFGRLVKNTVNCWIRHVVRTYAQKLCRSYCNCKSSCPLIADKKLCFCKDYSASIVHSTYICRGEVMDC